MVVQCVLVEHTRSRTHNGVHIYTNDLAALVRTLALALVDDDWTQPRTRYAACLSVCAPYDSTRWLLTFYACAPSHRIRAPKRQAHRPYLVVL